MKKYGLTDRVLALATMYPEYTVGRILSQEKAIGRDKFKLFETNVKALKYMKGFSLWIMKSSLTKM
ncbi:MAG: hypothetical protein J6K37_01135 [Lachnospiraceae bacterium]|nr:hypothetical protein [Lachnospiraceae bacterium]